MLGVECWALNVFHFHFAPFPVATRYKCVVNNPSATMPKIQPTEASSNRRSVSSLHLPQCPATHADKSDSSAAITFTENCSGTGVSPVCFVLAAKTPALLRLTGETPVSLTSTE